MQRLSSGGIRGVLAGAAAAVLTVASFLYSPIALDSSAQGLGMAIRTRFLLVALILAAISTWMLVFRPGSRGARLATSLSSGFNLIWFVSFVGPPVVLASLVAAVVATVGAPRRLVPVLIGLVVAGFVLGLVVLRLTEPPGEHIFG